jgi:5-formyltetrahydrofolate cyclo-ligase
LQYSVTQSITVGMATKSNLRRLITGTLKALDPVEIQQQSSDVFERIVNHDRFIEAQLISLYLSTNLEIDTIELLKYALKERKRCFVPYIDPNKANHMLMVELKSMHHYNKLPVNRFGIKEMASLIDDNGEQLEVATDLDLMIVPGVAFSLDGRRLGHGMGYYDRFLREWDQRRLSSGSNKRLYTIGLALREQLVDDPLAIAGQDYTVDEVLVAANRG